MMFRTLGIVFLVMAAMLMTVPTNNSLMSSDNYSSNLRSIPFRDPNATRTAFNYSISQADLFTNATAVVSTIPTSAKIVWFSTFNRTSSGASVKGTAFNFTVQPSASPNFQQINWTFPIPRSTCFNCMNSTIVRFSFQGNLTAATYANYTLAFARNNGNSSAAFPWVSRLGPVVFPGNVVSVSGCPSNSVCIPANKYVGYNMTLSFKFGWNANNKGLKVSVGEVLVGSISNTFTNSIANWMNINSTDSTKVNHTAKLLVNLLNSTTSYPNPLLTGPRTLNHTWPNQIINFYYPAGYNFTRLTLNSTLSNPPTTLLPASPRTAFEAIHCFDPACTQSLLSFNMSDFKPIGVLRNSTFTLSTLTRNSLHPTAPSTSVITSFGSLPLTRFAPGDNMTVKVNNQPSAANMTLTQANPSLTINFTDPNKNTQTLTGQIFPSASGGLFGFTLPQGPFGQWNATVYYTSNFDLGVSSTTFTIDQLVMAPRAVNPAISNNQLNINGRINYSSTQQAAGSVTGVVFAADASSGAIPVTATNSSAAGLYISNVTLVNGVFSTGQTLTMLFTVVNPSTQQYSANITIQHEWAPGRIHGINQTFQLRLGDEPFALGPVVYKMEVTITQNGIQTKVTSVQTQNSKTVTLSNNATSPVIPTRQHTGVFKISLTSALPNGTGLHSNSIETPPYAYVLAGPETSSGYLAHSTIFITAADGTFSTNIPANMTIGAGKLVIFALARDSNGIPLWNSNQDPTSFTDNTRLIASPDRIGEVTVRQQVTATLHITNNSTLLSQTITIDLFLDSSKVDSQTVTLSPGISTSRTFHFQAPGQPGSYSLTYSSAQYRTALASQTLQVVLVQGIVQLLIPLIIGIIAAIAVLGYYLAKKRPTSTSATTLTKPTSSGPRTKIFPLQMFN